jgi:sulfur relay (sulfurtransferase) DsrF/TusC family protein
MKGILKAFYTKPLAIYLVMALLAISTFAGPAEAMFVPSTSHLDQASARAVSATRTADLSRIQTALELKIVQQSLQDYGLSPEETMVRINKLSDEQIHQLATHTDSLQAGGDGGGFIIGLLIVALMVVLLIYLIQGRVVIK